MLGLVTNVSFLRELLGDDDVVAGAMDTGLIDRITTARPPASAAGPEVAAAALALLDASMASGPWGDRRGWRLGEPTTFVMRLVDGGGHTIEVGLRSIDADTWDATVGTWNARLRAAFHADRLQLSVDGVVEEYTISVSDTRVWLGRGGATWQFGPAPAHGPRRDAAAAAGLTVVSPMPGTVVSVDVSVGDEVAAGRAVAVVEAMKMEHTLRAAQRSIVRAVSVAAGERVDLHQILVVLEAVETTDA